MIAYLVRMSSTGETELRAVTICMSSFAGEKRARDNSANKNVAHATRYAGSAQCLLSYLINIVLGILIPTNLESLYVPADSR